MRVDKTPDGRYAITGSEELMDDIIRAMNNLADEEANRAGRTWDADRASSDFHMQKAQRARGLAVLIRGAMK